MKRTDANLKRFNEIKSSLLKQETVALNISNSHERQLMLRAIFDTAKEEYLNSLKWFNSWLNPAWRKLNGPCRVKNQSKWALENAVRYYELYEQIYIRSLNLGIIDEDLLDFDYDSVVYEEIQL